MAILFGTGMRRSELVALDVEDYRRSTGALSIRGGKGNKSRLVYLPPAGQPLEKSKTNMDSLQNNRQITQHIDQLNKAVHICQDFVNPILDRWLIERGNTLGALLMPISKTQKLQGRHLSEGAVLYLLQKRASLAGIASFTPHDCRRTFISNLLEAGVDIVTVSQLAGHASVTTTAKYDRRGEEAKRAAVNLLNLPF